MGGINIFIKLFILDGKQGKNHIEKGIPQQFYFKGNYAIEQCILKLVELYFGSSIMSKVEDLLKTRKEDDTNEL